MTTAPFPREHLPDHVADLAVGREVVLGAQQ
jgi:hypothetical protein